MPKGVYLRKYPAWNKGKRGMQQAWNKGLTKETDDRVAKKAKLQLGHPSGMKGKEPWNKGSSKETEPGMMKTSNKQKELWKNPMYAKKCLHRRILSAPEQAFIDMCKEFCFVGNGELVIDGKNPDFVCIKDDHKLVEVWGEYFKRSRNPQDLIDFYNVRGYSCLVIYASELKHPEQVVLKVHEFEASHG